MKYGIVVFRNTENLGDDILSYASERFLPSVDYILDRENLDIFVPDDNERVAVIMNGWYLHNKSHWPPSPFLYPFFIGIHFSDNNLMGIKDEFLDGLGRDYLIKYQPIGCRDSSTLKKMNERSISAYFSGCLTLTLNRFEGVEYSGKYFMVDVPADVTSKVISEVGSEAVEVVTHNVSAEAGRPNMSWENRRRQVETRLKKYQSAKLVITTRLHCALPCLALGIPVLLLTEKNDDIQARMSDYMDMLNNCQISEFLNNEYDWKGVVTNPDKHLVIRDRLIMECERFVRQCNDFEDKSGLPDYDSYLYISRMTDWQRSLVDGRIQYISSGVWEENIKAIAWFKDQMISKDARINELENWTSELEKAKEWFERQIAFKDDRIKELESWNMELEKAKEWYLNQIKVKDAKISELLSQN